MQYEIMYTTWFYNRFIQNVICYPGFNENLEG